MRKSRFSEAQIVAILRQFDAGAPAEELARRHGIHSNTIRLWRSKYAGMNASDLARLKQLEAENAQMQRIIARQTVKIDAMEELMLTLMEPSRRAEAVKALQTLGLSRREACATVRARRRSPDEKPSTKALEDARWGNPAN
jgi:putative transposase